uniref:NADH-ubiquinone oxidoreductase chain 2 n=1 Tax=Ctenisodes sp. 1 EF-2015 TaxID=1756872 RepID=A0A0S2M717_9COLE|nr:NADH deshydrogenase subunit 2 [Ctenisodes sp. 1 EF-2015]
MLMISTILSISSNSWMGMWIGLEINLMSIIPLMINMKNSYSSESSIKYFITQAISSAIILLSIILTMKSNNLSFQMNNIYSIMFNSAMFMKLGAAPFHFWFPEIIGGLSWMNCLILLTWQKITPMILSSYNNINIIFISFIIMFSIIIGSMMGLNQTNMRKILTYSSINHIGWMLASFLTFETIWTYYFTTYSILSIIIISIMNSFNILNIKQFSVFMSKNFLIYMIFLMNFLSLGGLPPFLGFMPKWLTINMMILNSFYILTFFMIICTLISLYYYIRLTLSSLTLLSNELNFYLSYNNHYFLYLINFINFSSLILCTLMFNFI